MAKRIKRSSYLLAVIVGLMSLSAAYGQDKPGRLTFDVAAIRRSDPNVRDGYIKATPGATAIRRRTSR